MAAMFEPDYCGPVDDLQEHRQQLQSDSVNWKDCIHRWKRSREKWRREALSLQQQTFEAARSASHWRSVAA
ncbi:hypothetical protein BOX15_Mlig033173g2 [Macrostomum lignano]|uniref:Uncharacterized protein n=1 Tax=Macrostomum lignano TaxID=282301 RepID=A0A267GIV6_9PLAT|nr:hypothetical protein BOX15_Mlig033173g2 [Macrostomum lignano]